MHDDLLQSLGFVVDGRPHVGESDETWLARDDRGRRVVLKVSTSPGVDARFALLVETVDLLRSRGHPIPRHGPVLVADGATVLVQEHVSGESTNRVTPRLAEEVVACIDLQADVATAPTPVTWPELLVRTLVVGEDGWAMHESMRAGDERTRWVLAWVEEVGAAADQLELPETGVVHLDLHHRNVLQAPHGDVVAVIDWGGAIRGDERFDLVTFVHGLTVAEVDQAVRWSLWDRVEAVIEPDVLRAYAAHLALRLVDWQLRHHPDEVEPWLVEAERLAARYG